MSLRYEQYRSLHDTRQLLSDILLGSLNDVEDIRISARHCLRHFPVLAETGEPMFSQDEFDCPALDEPYLGYEKS